MISAIRAHTALAAAGLALAVLTMPAWSQDISESHLKVAREALDATSATDQFDNVLPQAAQALKAQLIQKNPNLTDLIDKTVEKNALALADRRADLEKEAATAYARVFSEQELKEIAAFYGSPTGKKLLSDGPIVMREINKAAQIWQRGIARDLAQNVGKEIADAVAADSKASPDTGAKPAEQTSKPDAAKSQ